MVHYYTTDEWELFDLENDPKEMKSVYNDPEYAEIRKDLVMELARLQHLYRVPNDNMIHQTRR
ncbi:MAG: DUF4976 domain-containing protein [Planctomycetes bacterium]|nr:DUF4976 domain-containing protein [Planctomycetota bacterium]